MKRGIMKHIINFSKSFVPIILILIFLIVMIVYLESLADAHGNKAEIVKISQAVIFNGNEINSEYEILTRSKWYREFKGDSLFENAVGYFKRKDFRRALGAFENLLNQTNRHPYLLFYTGLCHYYLMQYENAAELFEKVINKAPGFQSVYIYYALIYKDKHDYDKAKKLVEKSLAIKKEYPFGLFHLGGILNEMNQLEGAVSVLKEALEISTVKFKPFVYNELGKVYLKLSDKTNAEISFQKAVEYKPDYIEARMNTLKLYDDTPNSFKQKIAVLQDILSLNPGHTPAYYELGMLFYKQKKLTEAHNYFTKANTQNPFYSKAQSGLALLNLEKGQIEDAEEIFTALLAADSLMPENYFYLAKAKAGKNDYDKALKFYRKAVELANGYYPEAWLNMGVIYEKLNKIDQAFLSYKKAVQNRPDYTSAYFNMGILHKKQNNINQAVNSYKKACRIKKDFYKGWYNLGVLYSETGVIDSAVSAYKQAVLHKPDFLKARINLAILFNKTSRIEKAIKHYKWITENFPAYSTAWFNLALIYSGKGKLQKAADTYLRLLQIEPGNNKARLNLGVLYGRLKLNEEAVSIYREGLEIEPSNIKIRFNLALKYKQLKLKKKAISELKKVTRLDPDNLKAWENLARLYEQKKMYVNTATAFSNVWKLSDKPVSMPYEIGRLYYKGKDYAKAFEWFSESIKAQYKMDWSYYWIARSFQKTDNFEEAIANYQKALNRNSNHFQAWKQLGEVYLNLNDKTNAKASLLAAQKIKPDDNRIKKLLSRL